MGDDPLALSVKVGISLAEDGWPESSEGAARSKFVNGFEAKKGGERGDLLVVICLNGNY